MLCYLPLTVSNVIGQGSCTGCLYSQQSRLLRLGRSYIVYCLSLLESIKAEEKTFTNFKFCQQFSEVLFMKICYNCQNTDTSFQPITIYSSTVMAMLTYRVPILSRKSQMSVVNGFSCYKYCRLMQQRTRMVGCCLPLADKAEFCPQQSSKLSCR